jgi:hypothetical protein
MIAASTLLTVLDPTRELERSELHCATGAQVQQVIQGRTYSVCVIEGQRKLLVTSALPGDFVKQ